MLKSAKFAFFRFPDFSAKWRNAKVGAVAVTRARGRLRGRRSNPATAQFYCVVRISDWLVFTIANRIASRPESNLALASFQSRPNSNARDITPATPSQIAGSPDANPKTQPRALETRNRPRALFATTRGTPSKLRAGSRTTKGVGCCVFAIARLAALGGCASRKVPFYAGQRAPTLENT